MISARSDDGTLRSWPLYVLAAPATVAVWSGWVGLGEMTGFGKVHPLPGIADHFSINTAITLPIGVEAYAAYALGAWLTRKRLSDGTRAFARISALGALALGALGQIAYHLLEVGQHKHAPTWITTLVACFPVLVLGLGATLAHLIHRDGENESVAQATDLDAVQATETPVTQGIPAPLTQVSPEVTREATRQVTAAPLTQGTPQATDPVTVEVTDQATPATGRKSPTKSRGKAAPKSRRTDAELIADLEKLVAAHYREHPGEEIKVQPIAKQLGIGRDRARLLLDQMNVRPIRREATG